MEMPAVLLISHSFYPSHEIGARRPTAFARFLVSKGVKVVVVSAFGEAPISPGTEIIPGVVAIPVRAGKRILIDRVVALKRRIRGVRPTGVRDESARGNRQNNRGSRWLGVARDLFFRTVGFIDTYKAWGRRAYIAAVRAGREHRVSAVLSSSPPQTMLLVGALAARALQQPHIVDLRDPWTDQLGRGDLLSRAEYWVSRRLETRVLHSAAAILSAGAKAADLLAKRNPSLKGRIAVVRNGFDGGFVDRSRQTGGKLTILFAGELYRNRNPFKFLQALEELLQRDDVQAARVSVTFMGDVATYRDQDLAQWLGGKACKDCVRILPRQPKTVVDSAVQDSTVLLNLAQGQPLQIPAKTYEHLASSRELLVLCETDSETGQTISGIEGVNCVDPNDGDDLLKTLLMLYRRHVLEGELLAPTEIAVAKFSREASNEQFWRVIGVVAGLGGLVAKETSR